MTRYAADTQVSVDSSRAEIERTLTRYGATAFMYGWDAVGDLGAQPLAGGGAVGEDHVREELVFELRDAGLDGFELRLDDEREGAPLHAACLLPRLQPILVAALALAGGRESEGVVVLVGERQLEADESFGGGELDDGVVAYATRSMPTILPALGTGA